MSLPGDRPLQALLFPSDAPNVTDVSNDNVAAIPDAEEIVDPEETEPIDEEEDHNNTGSNEALPLLTRPRALTASSALAKRRRLSASEEFTPSCSSNNSVHNSSFSNGFSLIKPEEGPLDTETIAREVRVLLRQRCMRQTDLAPYVGCRPGSVAGVIAKAGLPWSALNEFNRSVFTAMAKWIEDVRNNTLPTCSNFSGGVPSHFSTVSPVPSVSSAVGSVTSIPHATPNPEAPRIAQTSPRQSPPAVLPTQPLTISQPWATAKCSLNSGYLLFLENMQIAVPGRGTLFASANLSIASGKRYGLVGPSECGTSTLLRFIAAKEDLNIPPEIEIEGCDQSKLDTEDVIEMSETEKTFEYVLQLERRWNKLKAEEAYLEPLVKKGDNRDAFTRLRQVYEQLCYFGSGSAEAKARQLLTGLGFSLEAQNGLVKDLSLRSRKVASLARALFAEPALLLVDRPTNFLDVDSVIWLETYLKNWPTSLLIVTQDRCFMDAVCSAIIYVHSQKLFYYQGNYSRFKQQISQK